ncbi:hypothetical protein H0H87_009945 [Tephrocybe sp. NHM501043]|nr:hypothetical protein H0H87_009945 [Tephrocybe sp. NHM501043]
MAPYASATCLFKQIIGSLGARYLPGFGFEPFRPVKITPVYFPGWIVDGEVSLDVMCGDEKHRTSGFSKDSYLPGSDFRVLSWVSYASDSAQQTVPFTEDLTHQHGVDVTCIPYTISPFAGFGLAQSTTEAIQLQNDIIIQPNSMDTHLLAAYPVLFPLYLAQYEYAYPGKERLVTFFIEASEHGRRIRSEKLDIGQDLRETYPLAPKALVNFTHSLDDVDVPCLNDVPAPFFRLFGFHPTSERLGLAGLLKDWLGNAVVTHGTGPKLVEKSGIISSDDDLRIRPYTLEERAGVERWLALSQEIDAMSRVARTMKETQELARATNKAVPQDVLDKTIESLESKVVELQARQDEVTPDWWQKWKGRTT